MYIYIVPEDNYRLYMCCNKILQPKTVLHAALHDPPRVLSYEIEIITYLHQSKSLIIAQIQIGSSRHYISCDILQSANDRMYCPTKRTTVIIL